METRDAAVDQSGLTSDSDGVPNGVQHGSSPDDAQELSRRERERLMRRQLMLDAARAVFAEKGFADATLDEIAQRAEFGKGTLYNYFEGGKEEILFAIFDDLYAALSRVIDETFSPAMIREQPIRDVFQGFLAAMFRFFIERQDQFMVMMKEGHRIAFSEDAHQAVYFQQRSERIIHELVPAIDAAKEIGAMRDFPSISVAHMIIGNVKGYHMHMVMSDCRPSFETAGELPTPEEAARFLSTFLLDGLLTDQDD